MKYVLAFLLALLCPWIMVLLVYLWRYRSGGPHRGGSR